MKGFEYKCSDTNITSFEGIPKQSTGMITAIGCKSLTSLNGLPKKILGDLNIAFCDNLTSLEGIPNEITGTLQIFQIKSHFTEEEIRKITKCDKIIT